jgi:RNA polymerase sigma-70 factor (ECF subfamily)
MEDRELIEKLLARDESAVKEFYDTYSPPLLRFIHGKINERADVEEIAQDTLFAFLDGARDFTYQCKLSTYLCSIASHKIIDFYRRRKLKKIVFSQMPAGFEILAGQGSDPEDLFTKKFIKEKIKGVLRRISPHYSRIIFLKYEEGRSVEEIAKILSISFKSAESILFRARKAFVQLYTAGGET